MINLDLHENRYIRMLLILLVLHHICNDIVPLRNDKYGLKF